MVSIKNKNVANWAMDYDIEINRVTCTVSICVPRAPQCFQHPGWGTGWQTAWRHAWTNVNLVKHLC